MRVRNCLIFVDHIEVIGMQQMYYCMSYEGDQALDLDDKSVGNFDPSAIDAGAESIYLLDYLYC